MQKPKPIWTLALALTSAGSAFCATPLHAETTAPTATAERAPADAAADPAFDAAEAKAADAAEQKRHTDALTAWTKRLESADLVRAEITKRAEYLFNAHLQYTKLVQEFDALLNDSAQVDNALTSPTYGKIWALRDLIEDMQGQLGDGYEAFTLALANPKLKKLQPTAKQAIAQINDLLAGKTGFDFATTQLAQQAFANLAQTLSLSLVSARDEAPRAIGPAGAAAAAAAISGQTQRIDQLAAAAEPAVGEDADAAALQQALAAQEGKPEFQALSKKVEENAQKPGNVTDRDPAQAGIKPDAGSSGNVSGSNWSKGVWSMTYDDGPSTKYTPTILQNLKNHNVKATFFQLASVASASNAAKNLTKSMAVSWKGEAQLANHSYTHAQLNKAGANLNKEVVQSKAVLQAIHGQTIRLFRLPYGAGVSNGSTVRKKIAAAQMVHVFWNVDTLDWKGGSASSIAARAMKQVKANHNAGHGGIILFHDIHPQSVTASNMVLNTLTDTLKGGSKWCSVQAVINTLNGGNDCK